MLSIEVLKKEDYKKWDDYVLKHPHGLIYHQTAFKDTIEKTYKRKSYYFVACENGSLKGVLPLFHITGFLFGNSLVSMPFSDYGGILADNHDVEKELFKEAISLSQKLKCDYLELRQTYELKSLLSGEYSNNKLFYLNSSKVRMKLKLPDSSETFFKDIKAKLRAQIRRPQKEGCTAISGGIELLDQFYSVFQYNMRDLGSPIHSRKMMENFIRIYGDKARVFIVLKDNVPLACSVAAGINDVLINPWASSDRRYQKIAPNMLLYWEMIKYAIESGYSYFDFGRSTEGEGTYRFKQQWGAEPENMYWYYLSNKEGLDFAGNESGGKKELFIKVWQKLPLPLTSFLGPILRKQISL